MAKTKTRPAPQTRKPKARTNGRVPAKRGRARNPTEVRPELQLPGVYGADASTDPRNWRCAMCGQSMVAQGFVPRGAGSGKKGRVRKYDTDECRELAALIGDLNSDGHSSTLDNLLRFVSNRAAVPEVRLILRKKLWKFTNQIPWNRGVENLRLKRKRGEVAAADPADLLRRAEREENKLARLLTKRDRLLREIDSLGRSLARTSDRGVAETLTFKQAALAEADEDIALQSATAKQARRRAQG